MPFFFYDQTMLLLIPAIILALWAQQRVKSTFNKYSKIPAVTGMTGGAIAERLLQESGLNDIEIEEVPGQLTDHYDPRKRKLRLSSAIFRSRSVAAIGVAAHEVGHAIQHKQAYVAFQLRQNIFPVANLGSTLAFPLFIAGFLFASPKLMDIGIVLFSAAVLFQVVTLPVELNASSRALALLRSRGYLAEEEVGHARKVLHAAALTYVAATAVAVLHLLRLVLLRGTRD
ncbi:zinc metallopeptidase [bacterium]|nr:zinc metallopeptidase [bacterium]RQV93769.1 MAG: zinc metallopeptidase [bacterium]